MANYWLKILLLPTITLFSQLVSAGDPTRPQWGQAAQIESGKKGSGLTAIFKTAKGNKALIDGKLYRQGDHYRGQRIVKIESHRVLLRGAQGTRFLTLIAKVKK